VKTRVSKLEFETTNSATIHCFRSDLEDIVTTQALEKPIARRISEAALTR
jgi:hypothetical protein